MSNQPSSDNPLSVVDCKVVYTESMTDLVTEAADGKRFNARTVLHDVKVGDEGKTIPFRDGYLFIRKPRDED